MRIRMLYNTLGSPRGFGVLNYSAGEVYDTESEGDDHIPSFLANLFVRRGNAEWMPHPVILAFPSTQAGRREVYEKLRGRL